jgi:7-cyano-7-deazaguanine reductase
MKQKNDIPNGSNKALGRRNFEALGKRVTEFKQLETFPRPEGVYDVTCISDEVTALCPVTGQPDWYVVRINYAPRNLCVESKTVKLFLQQFRNEGHFCEEFASIIAKAFSDALQAERVTVSVEQKPRGGVAIHATATYCWEDAESKGVNPE